MSKRLVDDAVWIPGRRQHFFNEYGDAKNSECEACDRVAAQNDDTEQVLYRGKHCYVIHSPTPYTVGHFLIIPNRHVCSIRELLDRESLDIMQTQQMCMEVLDAVIRPNGYDTGTSAGKVEHGTASRHLVFHVVPRRMGDKNLMLTIRTRRELQMLQRNAHQAFRREFEERVFVE